MPPIDSTYPVETPDGVDLDIHPAGPVPRAAAWMVDLLVRSGIMIMLIFILSGFNAVGFAMLVLAWFLINWWYPVLFEVLGNGATPGKRAFDIRVIHDDGTPVGWGPSVVRNLLRQVDFLPLLYMTGLISMLCNRRFQRLGDLAAGTVVIHGDNRRITLPELPPGETRHPPIPLKPDEQQAVLSFAERIRSLNPARAEELANLLEPVTGQTGPEAVDELLTWARWMRGQAT